RKRIEWRTCDAESPRILRQPPPLLALNNAAREPLITGRDCSVESGDASIASRRFRRRRIPAHRSTRELARALQIRLRPRDLRPDADDTRNLDSEPAARKREPDVGAERVANHKHFALTAHQRRNFGCVTADAVLALPCRCAMTAEIRCERFTQCALLDLSSHAI